MHVAADLVEFPWVVNICESFRGISIIRALKQSTPHGKLTCVMSHGIILKGTLIFQPSIFRRLCLFFRECNLHPYGRVQLFQSHKNPLGKWSFLVPNPQPARVYCKLLGPWGWETSNLKNDGNPYNGALFSPHPGLGLMSLSPIIWK